MGKMKELYMAFIEEVENEGEGLDQDQICEEATRRVKEHLADLGDYLYEQQKDRRYEDET
jgi:hypothetical protein